MTQSNIQEVSYKTHDVPPRGLIWFFLVGIVLLISPVLADEPLQVEGLVPGGEKGPFSPYGYMGHYLVNFLGNNLEGSEFIVTNKSTNGSLDSILRIGKASNTFAIVQSDVLHQFRAGRFQMGGEEGFAVRGIAKLFPEAVFFVRYDNINDKNVNNPLGAFRTSNVSVYAASGGLGSGTFQTAQSIFRATSFDGGLSREKFGAVNTNIFCGIHVQSPEFTPWGGGGKIGATGFWTLSKTEALMIEAQYPEGVYHQGEQYFERAGLSSAKNDEDATCLGVDGILVCSADMPDEVVKTIYRALEALERELQAFKPLVDGKKRKLKEVSADEVGAQEVLNFTSFSNYWDPTGSKDLFTKRSKDLPIVLHREVSRQPMGELEKALVSPSIQVRTLRASLTFLLLLFLTYQGYKSLLLRKVSPRRILLVVGAFLFAHGLAAFLIWFSEHNHLGRLAPISGQLTHAHTTLGWLIGHLATGENFGVRLVSPYSIFWVGALKAGYAATVFLVLARASTRLYEYIQSQRFRGHVVVIGPKEKIPLIIAGMPKAGLSCFSLDFDDDKREDTELFERYARNLFARFRLESARSVLIIGDYPSSTGEMGPYSSDMKVIRNLLALREYLDRKNSNPIVFFELHSDKISSVFCENEPKREGERCLSSFMLAEQLAAQCLFQPLAYQVLESIFLERESRGQIQWSKTKPTQPILSARSSGKVVDCLQHETPDDADYYTFIAGCGVERASLFSRLAAPGSEGNSKWSGVSPTMKSRDRIVQASTLEGGDISIIILGLNNGLQIVCREMMQSAWTSRVDSIRLHLLVTDCQAAEVKLRAIFRELKLERKNVYLIPRECLNSKCDGQGAGDSAEVVEIHLREIANGHDFEKFFSEQKSNSSSLRILVLKDQTASEHFNCGDMAAWTALCVAAARAEAPHALIIAISDFLSDHGNYFELGCDVAINAPRFCLSLARSFVESPHLHDLFEMLRTTKAESTEVRVCRSTSSNSMRIGSFDPDRWTFCFAPWKDLPCRSGGSVIITHEGTLDVYLDE